MKHFHYRDIYGSDTMNPGIKYNSFYSGKSFTKYKHKVGDICSRCHKGKLRVIEGKFGVFFGCSEFPKCHYVCHLPGSNFSTYGKVANWRMKNNNSPGKIIVKFEDTQCPFCINGRLRTINGKFGKFLACTEYPNCKYTRKIS